MADEVLALLPATTDARTANGLIRVQLTWVFSGTYDPAPSAHNTFYWTAHADENYAFSAGFFTSGSTNIVNKAVTAVTITPTTDPAKLTQRYNGSTIDLSELFLFDPICDEATYEITTGGTGIGSVSGSSLTVTKAGTFPINVSIAGNGNYLAASSGITLTVERGTGACTVSMADYGYGSTISQPSVIGTANTPTYYYATTNTNSGGTAWTTVTSATSLPAGSYWMYAVLAQNDVYNAYTTTATPFRVTTAQVNTLDLTSLIAVPKKNNTPQAAFGNQSQFTGALSWNGSPVKFLGGTAYTAALTLSPTASYTLEGLAADSFRHSGAESVSYNPSTRTVTLLFPATEQREITAFSAQGTISKTVYSIGETFDPYGLTLTVGYDDGSAQIITSGYTIQPAAMAYNTSTVTLSYGGQTTAAISGFTVRENLTAIIAPAAITNVPNGTEKAEAKLGLLPTIAITTSTGATTSATVVWNVADCSYDASSTNAQHFTVDGAVTPPIPISNVNKIPLSVQISISVLAANSIAPPPAVESGDTNERITGLRAGDAIPVGTVLSISADEFVRGGFTYVPLSWRVNPSGLFARSCGVTNTAAINTAGMLLGVHALTITYRQVDSANRSATGNVALTTIPFTIYSAAPSPRITVQPRDQYVTVGQQATLSLSAIGDELKYQWFVNPKGGGFVAINGATNASFTIPTVLSENDGYAYQCIITDVSGQTAYSAIVTLHISRTVMPPKTGDHASPELWLLLCLLCGALMAKTLADMNTRTSGMDGSAPTESIALPCRLARRSPTARAASRAFGRAARCHSK